MLGLVLLAAVVCHLACAASKLVRRRLSTHGTLEQLTFQQPRAFLALPAEQDILSFIVFESQAESSKGIRAILYCCTRQKQACDDRRMPVMASDREGARRPVLLGPIAAACTVEVAPDRCVDAATGTRLGSE